jgi:hypothetical protein
MWNEIKQRATTFSKEWAGETREDAQAKIFWDGFSNVFGIKRRLVATFQEPVKNLKGSYGYIELFWKKMLLAENKSEGKEFGKRRIRKQDDWKKDSEGGSRLPL